MSVIDMVPSKGQELKFHLLQGITLALFLTGVSYLVGFGFGWINSVNYLEAFAVVTSYLCTFLCVMERRINYPIGVVTTAAYCILFYQWGLLASMAVNAYLVFALAYGWFRWKSDDNTRPVTHLEIKWIPAYVLATAAGYAGVVLITNALGATLPLADSVILIGTLLAQFLLDNKKIENWSVWAVVNVFAIYTYFTAGLALAGFQYIFFLANTVYGFYMWKASKNEVSAHGPITKTEAEFIRSLTSLPEVKEAAAR